MFIAYIISGILMAALATFSAVAKLRRNPRVMKSLHEEIGIPMTWIRVLAACEIAGAVGLLIGIAWSPLGLAAAIGLVIYFAGAVIAHARIKDFKGMSNPAVPLVLALIVLVTRILSF